MPSKKKKRPGKEQYKVVLADVFFKTLRCTLQELAETRAKAERLHVHVYDREPGYGVELYRCRECGDGWGHVLSGEKSVRY